MQHDVVDVSEDVHKIYNYIDPVALEDMIIEVPLEVFLFSEECGHHNRCMITLVNYSALDTLSPCRLKSPGSLTNTVFRGQWFYHRLQTVALIMP